MKNFKCLKSNFFSSGKFSLVPIRFQDRYEIMEWRNSQIFHLRQSEYLTKENQDSYFNNIIKKNFEQKNPKQILFSFLKDHKCVGYGGLVHIDWISRNAEISFVMDSQFEDKYFVNYWFEFLS